MMINMTLIGNSNNLCITKHDGKKMTVRTPNIIIRITKELMSCLLFLMMTMMMKEVTVMFLMKRMMIVIILTVVI